MPLEFDGLYVGINLQLANEYEGIDLEHDERLFRDTESDMGVLSSYDMYVNHFYRPMQLVYVVESSKIVLLERFAPNTLKGTTSPTQDALHRMQEARRSPIHVPESTERVNDSDGEDEEVIDYSIRPDEDAIAGDVYDEH